MSGPRLFSTHLDGSKMLPHRVIASAMARSCFAKIVSLSTADRLPARTRVEATSTPSLQGASTNSTYWQSNSASAASVLARSVSACSRARAKRRARSRRAAGRIAPRASAHYLAAALTNPWLAHRPWHSKHASARYGEGQFIGLNMAIYGDAFTAISALRC